MYDDRDSDSAGCAPDGSRDEFVLCRENLWLVYSEATRDAVTRASVDQC